MLAFFNKDRAVYKTHPVTLHTTLGILLLVTRYAHHFLVTWYKALIADWLLADLAAEALFMPLLALVLVLLHACRMRQFD